MKLTHGRAFASRAPLALLAALALIGLGGVLAAPARASGNYVVTTTADSGTGSLREAITQADANPGSKIDFAIGSGAQEIQPLTPLPAITVPTLINGATQGGNGYTGSPLIRLDGSKVTSGKPDGLLFTGGPGEVGGLEITGWKGAGIELRKGSSRTSPGNDNTIEGDYIGTDGSSALANGIGVLIDGGSQGNTIGGDDPASADVISGNSGPGVELSGSGVSGNTVKADLIGTDATGKTVVANQYDGVDIVGGASGNTIGGPAANVRDVISGNGTGITSYDNVDIGRSNMNTVEGDYIGTDVSGTSALANTYDGVYIYGGAKDNTIGGTDPGTGNVISGNTEMGVEIDDSGTTGNMIQGDLIGTDQSGSNPLGNGWAGVFLGSGASLNTVGGTSSAARDVISGNGALNNANNDYDGIDIYKANKNVVEGDYIGTDPGGTQSLANTASGVSLYGGSTGNVVGGTATGAGNVISGNSENGVYLSDNATGNTVAGDLIGTDETGEAPLGNGQSGVYLVGANANTIGGTSSAARDVISGNSTSGFDYYNGVESYESQRNVIEGDYIGTDAVGTKSLGNDGTGVVLSYSSNNMIGGASAGARDLISGNRDDGVDIYGTATGARAARQNTVAGDYIGTEVDGSTALANGEDGVYVEDGSANTIGGTVPGSGDVLSGNTLRGVEIYGASKNLVEGDYIGTDDTGEAPVGNGHDGVFIQDDTTDNDYAADNTIGGKTKSARNVISANGAAGEYNGVEVTASDNLIQGNYIGVDAQNSKTTLGNAGDGVLIDGGAGNTTGGTAAGEGNTIDYNLANGVEVNGVSGNPIETNSIFNNTDLGIALTASGNDSEPAPTIDPPVASHQSLVIRGTIPSTSGSFRVEVFADPTCPSTSGQLFLGAASASRGQWTLSVPLTKLGSDTGLTATSTDTKALNTSEFSTCQSTTAVMAGPRAELQQPLAPAGHHDSGGSPREQGPAPQPPKPIGSHHG